MSVHIFDNIEAKGATRNYNTKPNEKMHGSLKDSYQMRTNFRNVAPQVTDFILNIIDLLILDYCYNIYRFFASIIGKWSPRAFAGTYPTSMSISHAMSTMYWTKTIPWWMIWSSRTTRLM
jgi:hypothetical protein